MYMYNTSEYMKYHIFELQRRYEDMIDHSSFTHNLESSGLIFFQALISHLRVCKTAIINHVFSNMHNAITTNEWLSVSNSFIKMLIQLKLKL